MRDIVFDTETTGLSPKNGDRMVEIGCVELVDMRETGRTLHMYFNPERDMPAEAERVHGLSEKFLSDKPLFAEKAEEMLAFFGDDFRGWWRIMPNLIWVLSMPNWRDVAMRPFPMTEWWILPPMRGANFRDHRHLWMPYVAVLALIAATG